jgi:hypothetical protein
MSTKEEQLKKLQEEEKRRDEAFKLALEQERKEKALKEAALATAEKEQRQVGKESYFTPSPGKNKSDWEKILEDYKKKYPDQSVKDNVLTFTSLDEATKFFKDQATANPPRKFFMEEIDENGKPTGLNFFSCGNGKMYQGTLNEIQDQLKADQRANPDDPNIQEGLGDIARALNPARDFRAALKETKGVEEKKEQAQAQAPEPAPEADEGTEHTAPNPYSTKPSKTPL